MSGFGLHPSSASSVPTGGATGQVLGKASSADGDLNWITPAGGGDAVKATNEAITGAWTFRTMPQVHAASGDATPISGRAPGDGLTVGAFNIVHDGTSGDLFHLTTGPNTSVARTITDAVTTSGSTTVTTATGAMVSGNVGTDVGRTVTGTGIPAGTVIRSVPNATSFTLGTPAGATVNATASGTVSLVLGSGGGSGNSNGAVLAIGVDNAATGIVIQNKSTGQGMTLNQLSTVGASSQLVNISQQSATTAVKGVYTATGSAPLIRLQGANAVAGTAIQDWYDQGAAPLSHRIMADTGIWDGRRTIQTVAPSSGVTPLIRVADEVASNPTEAYLTAKTNADIGLRVYRYSGSTTLMYAHAWLATSDRFKLQVGNGAQTKGAETMATLIEVRANATPQMGFFGATPVAQQGATTDLRAALINLGFIVTGGASPLDLNGGALTAATGGFTDHVTTENTKGFRSKEAGGTARTFATISAGGTMLFGDPASGTVQHQGTQLLFAPGTTPTSKLTISSAGLVVSDGVPIKFNTTTGTKIGGGTTEKFAFWNATPVVQPSGTPAAATDAATTQALVNDIRSKLVTLGLIA